jgi:hypothetical protein
MLGSAQFAGAYKRLIPQYKPDSFCITSAATRIAPSVTPAVDWPGKIESPTNHRLSMPVRGPRALHIEV